MVRRTPTKPAPWSRRTRCALPALLVLSQFFATTAVNAQDGNGKTEKLATRADRAAEALAELVSVPDRAPPKDLLAAASCVAVLPEVVQAGLGIGGRFGYGLASCRTPTGWSLPTYVGLKGGSVGFQIGAEASDLVLVFVNKDAAQLASSTFNLGGDASVAAGPIGRNLSAETDYRLRAEIYSYSKSKGAYAGVSLSGTRWELDYKANRAVYQATPNLPRGGDAKGVEKLLTAGGAHAPATVRPFLESLEKNVGPGMER